MDKLNITEAIKSIESQIKSYIGHRKAVIGISGGIDSAVVASLCVRALGKENVIGIQMPYGEQSTEDGDKLVKHLELESLTYNIKHIVQSFPISSPSMHPNVENARLVNGNIRARTRMTLLYAYAGMRNGIVVGTSNKTEIMLGYFTKYGDGGCDIEPIGDIYKTEIFEVAKVLEVPESIVTKKPSAELWVGQTDEGEIGMTYAEMDEILRSGLYPFTDVPNAYGDKGRKLLERMASTNHKREMPPVFSVAIARSF